MAAPIHLALGRVTAPGAGRSRSGHGVRFTGDTPLVAAALDLLRDGPRPGPALASRLFGLRSVPPDLARRLLEELLGEDPRVRRDRRDVWRLARDPERNGDGFLLRDGDWTVVDVEATGGSPALGARIIEIAAVQVRGRRIEREFSSLVDPGIPLPAGVSRLTGITDAQLAAAPRFEEISDTVREMMEGRVFVAHNVAFDWRFVAAEMRRARSLLPTGPRLCTLRLAGRALPGLDRRGLDAICRFYGIEIARRHRAPDDARAAARVLARLLDEAERRGVTGWRELQGWLAGGNGGSPRGRKSRC